MARLRNLTTNTEGYLVSLVERPEVLAGKFYGIKTYKQALRELAIYLLNSIVIFIDFEYEYRLIAYAWYLWTKENDDLPESEKTASAFIKRLRVDLAFRINYEMEDRED